MGNSNKELEAFNADVIDISALAVHNVVLSSMGSDLEASQTLYVTSLKGQLSSLQCTLKGAKIKYINIEDLKEIVGDKANSNAYETVVLENVLFTTTHYKDVIIHIHKLLKTEGQFVSYDFLIDDYAPDISSGSSSSSEDETACLNQSLKEIFSYNIEKENEKRSFLSKLEKYNYKDMICKDCTNLYLGTLRKISSVGENSELIEILTNKNVKFMKTMSIRKESNGVAMEPRVRDKNGFRSRASAVIFRSVPNEEPEFLLIKRRTDGWTFAGGGIEENESKNEAVIRECLEESGAVCEIVKDFSVLKNISRKTFTHVFLVRCVREEVEYPENDRPKKWFSKSQMEEEFEIINETNFFGEGLDNTTKQMMRLVWPKLPDLKVVN